MTPLVLIPGMMCDARLFAPQIDAFSGHRPIHLATLVSANSTRGLAAEILRHAPSRFALAGLSMGGIVAMEIMAQAPDRVERLALLDTNPLAERPEIARAREQQIARVRAGGLREVMRDELKPNYLVEGPQRAQVLDICMAMAEALGPGAFERQSRALQFRPDRQDVLRAVTCPTLILCGRHDMLCPVERHELMRNLIPGSELVVVDGAGHMPTLEQPRVTNAALARWLEA